jgi:hypothetical protein
MQVTSVGELKHTHVEVITVYLLVDFAAYLALLGGSVGVYQSIKPTAALLIAAALHLAGNGWGRALEG